MDRAVNRQVSENAMKIQETIIAIIFGAMILVAMLAGQKSNEKFFPLREWDRKDEFVPDTLGAIRVEPKTGMEFVWVQAGCFEMGCINGTRQQCNPNEYPVHKVCLEGFWIGRHTVTQKQWLRIFDENPSFFKNNADHPVEKVSWHDARKYITEMNLREGKDVFRLPTEAEWEYACRDNKYPMNYSGSMNPEEVAWHRGNSGGSTRPVGSRMPNKLGLFDMSGNVFEWVQDVYEEKAYERHNVHNPMVDTGLGPSYDRYLPLIEPYIGSDSLRVIRGGSWRHAPTAARCSSRYSMAAGSRQNYLGFRVVANLPDPPNSER
jgi:formylglycine-generating enzyme required for sulfatase activity